MRMVIAVLLAFAFAPFQRSAVGPQNNGRDLWVFVLGREFPLEPGQHVLSTPTPGTAFTPGSGGNANSYDTDVGLRTSLTATHVRTHFAAQISAAGWTLQDTAESGSSTLVARFVGQSTTGSPSSAVLAVLDLGNGTLHTSLRIVRHTSAVPIRSPSQMPARGARQLEAGGGAGAGMAGAATPGAARPLPDGFPAETLPPGAIVRSVSVSGSPTIVLATVRNFTAAHLPNLLQRLTDAGGGPTFYSCLVQVEKCGD